MRGKSWIVETSSELSNGEFVIELRLASGTDRGNGAANRQVHRGRQKTAQGETRGREVTRRRGLKTGRFLSYRPDFINFLYPLHSCHLEKSAGLATEP